MVVFTPHSLQRGKFEWIDATTDSHLGRINNCARAKAPAPGNAPNTTIRIDVNLVQVDAVVTDSHGKRVTNLEPSAFEILQDGKPQTISSLSYIVNKPASGGVAHVAIAKPVKGEVPPPPEVFQPIAVGRTMALVVDDLGLYQAKKAYARGQIGDCKSFV